MGRAVLGFVAVLVVGLAAASESRATHPSWIEDLTLNIDGDRGLEVVRLAYSVSSDHKYERGSVTASDTCDGRRVQVPLVRAGPFTPNIDLKPAQLGRAAAGTAGAYRDGLRVARVVRLRNCRLQVLLSFSSRAAVSVRFEARDDSARYPGREVVVIEGLRDAARRIFFRWLPSRQRYVRYRTMFSSA